MLREPSFRASLALSEQILRVRQHPLLGSSHGGVAESCGPYSDAVATIIEVDCRFCGFVSQQSDGPLMTALSFRCSECGSTRGVSFIDIGIDPGLASFEELERAALARAGTCECSGRFDAVAPIRCPACRSQDVSVTVIGHAD